ncbi:MAG TPA: DNA methyltransferase [Ignavibacteriaceae bacterium]|nr:DNA methyltransferase [Ignavibacteria bacterium]HOJ19346.1 DNA methyltransferase [Ignavibacteriaceae bacterium]
MILNKPKIIETLAELCKKDDFYEIKLGIKEISANTANLKTDMLGFLNIGLNGDTIKIDANYLNKEIAQILETQTLERTKYYIQRLIKSLTEIKTSKVNDLNLNRWKEYEDIITDSLWIMDKRDNSGAHNAGYWGNFIPQIPNQLLRRYTKQGEWVLDTFLGSGTTLIETKRLGRNAIGIELQAKVSEMAKSNIDREKNPFSENVKTEIITADSKELNYEDVLKKNGVKSVQFIIMHPPYWDIIKFSDNPKDLSNFKNIKDFLEAMGKIIEKTYSILDKNRYCALVIGDKYSGGEWIPLAFYTMQEFLKRGYKLKSTIIKNFEETKGKMNQKELWRYRALVGGFYIFKHEYIFLFKKDNSSNRHKSLV